MLRLFAVRSIPAVVFALTMAVPPAGAQSDGVAYHDFSTVSWGARGQMRIKAAVGQTGSVAIAEFPEGLRGSPHHHDQEQIVLALGGPVQTTMSGVDYRLDKYAAIVTLANVEHFSMNSGAGTASFIEFQPVRRHDWVPPYPPFSSSRSMVPAAAPANSSLFSDFATSSGGWKVDASGARSKTMGGRTIRLTVWDLASPKASTVLTVGDGAEAFAYVLEGQAEIVVRGTPRQIKSESLAIVSAAAGGVQLRALNGGRAVIAIFEGTAQ